MYSIDHLVDCYYENLKIKLEKEESILEHKIEQKASESLNDAKDLSSFITEAVYELENEHAKAALIDIANEQNSESLLKAARSLQKILREISYRVAAEGL